MPNSQWKLNNGIIIMLFKKLTMDLAKEKGYKSVSRHELLICLCEI